MRKKILELIKVMRRNLLDPLPKTPGQRKKIEAAKRALDMAELAVKVGKAPAAFLYALEYADFAYDAKNKDLIDAAKKLRRGAFSDNDKIKWLFEACELREANPSISKLQMARTIAPKNERSVRRFLTECEREGTLPKALA